MVGTYDINGICHKTTDLWHLLSAQHFDMLALQETLLRAVNGFLTFSALGHTGASHCGVSLLVSGRYSAQSVRPTSPFWVFVKMFGNGLLSPVI